MRNENCVEYDTNRKDPRLREPLRFIKLGYTDRINGRTFPVEYDIWETSRQVNYEIGRLWASNIMVSGAKPPAWRKTVIFPTTVEAALIRSLELAGDVVPVRETA